MSKKIKLCEGVTTMIQAYTEGVMLQQAWGQGYATLFLGMASQMNATPNFIDWCGSGKGRGDARDQVNTAVKDAIEKASKKKIKTSSLSVAWSLGVALAQITPTMGFKFVAPNPAATGDAKIGSITVNLTKLAKWVDSGGVLARDPGKPVIAWKSLTSKTRAFIKALGEIKVSDFPAGGAELKTLNELLANVRIMDRVVGGVPTPAAVNGKKKATKKSTTRKVATG